ncbi:MAG TPA: CBS domain-containing protein [Streptomyces sp.]|uniref:CBS domain-containing protein n=1 Tax=Streptomyces sp. TaxID=1931 RepID=UPI002D3BFA04|nr:CBS domain-containing protein [Streptomyces sp.]HZG06480.1 CBS domain-containing protein [Streptomyces sp.]
MKVRECMVSPVVTVPPDASARQAARRMREESVGCLLVVVEGEPRGIVTDRDLTVRCLAGDGSPQTPVSELMSPSVVTLDTTDDITVAYRTFRSAGVRRLPVLDGRRRVVGLLSVDDLFLDVFQRLADLLGPVAWTVLREPPEHHLTLPKLRPGLRRRK